MKIKEVIDFPVRYDDYGQQIWDSNNHLICDIRGWGRIQYMKDAEKIQDSVGQFICDAINRAIK